MVATMASLVISVSSLKSPNILKSGDGAHQEAMWSAERCPGRVNRVVLAVGRLLRSTSINGQWLRTALTDAMCHKRKCNRVIIQSRQSRLQAVGRVSQFPAL